jgi:endoglucanase
MPLPDLLERLLTTPGPSGHERAAAAVWREAAARSATSSVPGSSWARAPGTAAGRRFLSATQDEIGAIITHLGDDGFAAVRLIGVDPHVSAASASASPAAARVPGVVASRYRAEAARSEALDCRPLPRRRCGRRRGCAGSSGPATPSSGTARRSFCAAAHGPRSFDNRIGCYVALEAARRIAERGGGPGDVIAVAAVQEEVGDFAGSRTTAFATEPDVAIAIDVTRATDIRGGDHDDEGKIVLGSGATLTRGPSLHPGVFELLHDTAEAEGIPFSVEVSRGTTYTDADAVYLSRRGAPTVASRCRPRYAPLIERSISTTSSAVRLIVAFAGRLELTQLRG